MKVTELKNKYEKSAATGSIGYAGGCRVIMDEQYNDYAYCLKEGDKLYLTLFDNNYRDKESRVIKLRLDEQNKKLLEWKEYKVPGHYSEACGSAMYLGNDVFVIGELTFPKGLNKTYRCLKFLK